MNDSHDGNDHKYNDNDKHNNTNINIIMIIMIMIMIIIIMITMIMRGKKTSHNNDTSSIPKLNSLEGLSRCMLQKMVQILRHCVPCV